jgi:multidrug efflux pump subunit AcrA (membrane-fusion protein)
VAVTRAHLEPLEVLRRTSGTVRGRTTAVLTSRTTGYVRTIKVHSGDQVAAGQVLATLEAHDVEASVRRARAGFDQSLATRGEAENGLVAARANATIARSTRDRVARLFASDSISAQELDDAEARAQAATAQEQMAQSRIRAASSRIEQAKAEIGEASATLDYARITAPFAGRVIERRADPGNLASPGMPLLVVEEEGELRVEAAVEEALAGAVHLGDRATVEIDALEAPLEARVTEIVPSIDAASRAFLVKVELAGDVRKLRPGMFARAVFHVGSRARLVVPRTAVSSLGALDRVFVMDGDHVRIRMITTGETQGSFTEILSGLADGEMVVSAPAPTLRDGARTAVTP